MSEALEKHILKDKIKVFQDSKEALDFFFTTGKYSGCDTCTRLKVIILDFNLQKISGLELG